MAEKIVIAELIVDDKGVVRGIKEATEQVRLLGGQTKTTADAFEHHMFSMRSAAGALLGTFTVAGGILAFKDFLGSLVEATENFPKFTSAVHSAKTAIVEFYSAVLNVNQTVGDLTKLTNVVTHMFSTVKAATSEGGPLGAMWQFLWGQTAVGAIQNMLHSLTGVIEKVAPSLTAGPEQPTTESVQGSAGLQGFGVANFLQMTTSAFAQMKILAVESASLFRDNAGAAALADDAVEDLNSSIDELVRPSRWQQFKTEVRDAFSEVAMGMTTVNLMVDLIVGAVQQFTNEIAQGFSGAGMTFRKFVADMLMYIGRLLLAWGALALVTAYFGYGPGYKAAGVAFAAGIAAMAASRAIGGSGQNAGGDAAGGGYAGAGVAPPSAPSYAITIVNTGTVVSKEEWTRGVIIDIKQALADGAGGGGF